MEEYPFFCGGIGKRNHNPLLKEHRYRFTTKKNVRYHVIVEEYEYDFFGMKFYLRSHSQSKHKYNFLTRDFDARRILYTCVKIAHQIQEKNPIASFGFVGSPTIEELETTRLDNTKRFRAYSYFAKFFFSPDLFDHYYEAEKSLYIIYNKEKNTKDPNALNKIITMLENHYDIESLLIP